MKIISSDLLAPDERKELEAVLTAHRKGAAGDPTLRERFLSDLGDSAGWWILLLIAGLGGAVACGMFLAERGLDGFRAFAWALDQGYGVVAAIRSQQYLAGFVASVAILAWVAVLWANNHGRRGFAVTSFATIRVKGRRLALVRHAEVTRIEWTQHATRKQRFSALRLTGVDGSVLTLYVYAGWVRVAIAQIDQARAAAKLPPIEGDARKLPV